LFVAHTNIVMDGSAPHHGEDQLVQGTVGVDASDSTPLTSRDAPDFGLEPILSAISEDELLWFWVSYKSSGEVDEPRPYSGNIWKTIVKSVSKDRNLCIDISRQSEAFATFVCLSFSRNFVAEEEIPIMLMEEFANAIRSNPRIFVVRIQTSYGQELDRTPVTRFGTLVVNMFQMMLKSPSLQSADLITFGPGGLPLDQAAIESLASALRSNLTLNKFRIHQNEVCFSDTEGLKLFLEPLMIGGEGSYQGLKTLALNAIGIDDEGAEVVASMLRRNTSLTCISLWRNKIGPQGAVCIVEALRSNITLRKLHIGDNPIDVAGLKALVASLTHNMADGDLQPNSSLTHLSIRGHLGVEDMELLETLVRQNTSLLKLDLSWSFLLGVADDVIRLLEALKSNKCLLYVSLDYCHGVVGRRVLGTIFDLLEVNHHLKKLHLAETPLDKDGGAEMVEAVLEQKAKHNMWEVLQVMATARPNSARIFLCGYPYAGEPMDPISGSKTPSPSLSRLKKV
jgi:uncharacterized protein YbaR (Trm112 family)